MEKKLQQFNAAAVGKTFQTTCDQFDSLLGQKQDESTQAIKQKLHQELKAYQDDGILRVAFVGQYSAGKSTIISALTGRRDIKIDADIATDKTTNYSWNGIKLIDTPGLFTDRKDHDEITYDAINKADLLVFCLTYMLFDSVTVENFKKLAYDKGYRWKMMIVINKMSDEAGDEEAKIANYHESLAKALKPYSLDEFPVCFIDAKDYCEGVDEDDDFLLEISRFPTFTDKLNKFVERRASLARFDTPVRIALSCVDEAQVSFLRNSNEDPAFFEILNQMSHKVRRERSRLRTKVRGIALRLSAAVVNEGIVLAEEVGKANQEKIEALTKQVENNVEKYAEKAGLEMEEEVIAARQSLKEEIEKVLQGDLAQAFIASLDVNQKVSAPNVDYGIDIEQLKQQVNNLKEIGKVVGAKLANSAIKPGANTAGQVFLRSSNVAGSHLHKTVLGAGNLLKFKFAPWQAVKIAKGLGNFARIIGPVFDLISLGANIYAATNEDEQAQKLADGRRDLTSQFQAIAQDLENQVEKQLRDVEVEIYGGADKIIAEKRQQQEEAIATSNAWMKQLIEIRQSFELILQSITNVTKTKPNRPESDGVTKSLKLGYVRTCGN